MKVRKWASFGTCFDNHVRLVLKIGCALFADCVDVIGNSKEEVEDARNRLVVSDPNELQNWFFVLHARVVEDFAIIDEKAFINT
jgi:hypothetical protein